MSEREQARWARWVGGLMGLGLAACGALAQDAGSDDFDTGIAPSRPLSDITREEAIVACEEMLEDVQARLPSSYLSERVCTLIALSRATSPQSCRNLVQGCIRSPNAASDPYRGVDCARTSTDDFRGCNATVGELERCTQDFVGSVQGVLGGASCELAGSGSAAALGILALAGVSLPSSCDRIESQCPNAPIIELSETLRGRR